MTSLNMQTKSLSKMIKECRDGSPWGVRSQDPRNTE
jgi:hypothetical protein